MSLFYVCLEEVRVKYPQKYEEWISDVLQWERCVEECLEYLSKIPEREARVLLWIRFVKAIHNGMWKTYEQELPEKYREYFRKIPCYGYKPKWRFWECLEIVRSLLP